MTEAQILLRYAVERDHIVLTSSRRRERITENFNVLDFNLDAGDMAALDALNTDTEHLDLWLLKRREMY